MPSWDHTCKWHCRKVSAAERDVLSKYNQTYLNGIGNLFQDMCISLLLPFLVTKVLPHYFYCWNILLFLSNLRAWLHTKKFLSTSSPESYFHLGLRLLFSLLHYLLEFICDHFRRECMSSWTAQVHAHLHSCTVKNNLPVKGSLGPHLRTFSWEFSFWGISVTCQLCMIIVQ